MVSEGHKGNLMMNMYNARIVSQDGRTITLNVPLSRPNDALCCPSGGVIVLRYVWNGQAVVAIGATANFAPEPKRCTTLVACLTADNRGDDASRRENDVVLTHA